MGQAISYNGALTTGHGNHVPTVVTGGSSDVYVNGQAVSRVGDSIRSHTPDDNPCPPSGLKISGGSASVYVNGQPVARVSDDTICGDTLAQGANNVFCG